MKTFPTSAVWCFGILFISVALITTGLSEVQVVGPADPVVALAGDDIILPCSLKPNVSAEDMTVEWTGLYPTTRNVHLYRDGRDSNEEQFPSYRRRTSMFHEELKNGNVSLKLNRVTLSDAGSYRCLIPTLTSQMKDTTVQLFVVPTPIPSPAVPVLSMSLPRLLCSLLVGSPYLLVTIILLVKGCRSRTRGETRVPRKTHQDQLGDRVEEEWG
uniref:Myelin-oligodendrocyte glycoprotein n=1 Tax=Oncorhynchus mykiss TaxID=8022 RepID=C1BHF9_ONCMY|nr:Myelin-oligodendrocyte glycoprotein precursor [Oncorhynchus mykiss]